MPLTTAAATHQQQQGVSLRPDAFIKGGGLIDDVDVTVKEARFVTWDYNGGVQTPVLALGVTFTDEDNNDHDQYFSAGDLKFFVPSKDGKQAIPVGNKTGLVDSTNFAMFMTSLFNAGFPVDQIGEDISVIEGLYCHINRVAQPKRAGLPNQRQGANAERESTVITVTKIHRLPWEADDKTAKGKTATGKPAAGRAPATHAAAAAAASGKSNGKAAAAAATDPSADPMFGKAQETVSELLAENDGSVPRAKVSQLIFAKLAKDADRNAVVKLAYDINFLGADGQPWNFDGTTISLG